MFTHSETLSHYSRRNVIVWLTLAFQAGAINTGGLLACHKFVSHVTGFASLFGSYFAQQFYVSSVGILTVPLFFLLGTIISAYFIDRKIQLNERPLYPVVLFVMTLLLLFTTVFGINNGFGPFGNSGNNFQDYLLLTSLCLTCGMQNATVSSAFGSIIRTTHLTGITTDLGIGLQRVFFHSHKIQSRTNEIRANWMRVGIILHFVLGSFVSAFLYIHWQYWGFLLPTMISTVLFFWSLFRYLIQRKQPVLYDRHT